MDSHPGIVFRDGAAGRRAILAGGPDVWEVIRVITETREAEASLSPTEILELVSANSGASPKHVRLAMDYYGEFPDEIDGQIAEAVSAEEALRAAFARSNALLGA